MATGSSADFAWRLRRVLPARWFADDAPVLSALLAGAGAVWAAVYDLLIATQRQARLATVEGAFLDLAAIDFRADTFRRRVGESDDDFRGRLLPIFRDKVTRAALIARLQGLTGNTPAVFEPSRPADTGGLNGGMGLGTAGRLGSLQMPNQMLVLVSRPAGQGVPLIAGLGTPAGGLGAGRAALVSLTDEAPHVTDADIYAAIVDVLPAGAVAWVALSGATAGGVGYWDQTFNWDQSTWS